MYAYAWRQICVPHPWGVGSIASHAIYLFVMPWMTCPEPPARTCHACTLELRTRTQNHMYTYVTDMHVYMTTIMHV